MTDNSGIILWKDTLEILDKLYRYLFTNIVQKVILL